MGFGFFSIAIKLRKLPHIYIMLPVGSQWYRRMLRFFCHFHNYWFVAKFGQTLSWLTTFATSKIYLKEQCCYDSSFGLEKENPTLKNKIGLHTAPVYVTFMLSPSFLPLKNTNYWWKMKGKKFQVALCLGQSGIRWTVCSCSCSLLLPLLCLFCLGFPKCQTCSPWSLVTLRDDYGKPDKTQTKHVECWFAVVFAILLHTHYIQGNYHTWSSSSTNYVYLL